MKLSENGIEEKLEEWLCNVEQLIITKNSLLSEFFKIPQNTEYFIKLIHEPHYYPPTSAWFKRYTDLNTREVFPICMKGVPKN